MITDDQSDHGLILSARKNITYFLLYTYNTLLIFPEGRPVIICWFLAGVENREGYRTLRKPCRTVRGKSFVV